MFAHDVFFLSISSIYDIHCESSSTLQHTKPHYEKMAIKKALLYQKDIQNLY